MMDEGEIRQLIVALFSEILLNSTPQLTVFGVLGNLHELFMQKKGSLFM